MSPPDSLGIGFVGAGFITGTFHAETLRGIRYAHAAGILNPTREKAERVAATLTEHGCGDPTVHDSVDALVRDPEVDLSGYVPGPARGDFDPSVEGLTGGD